MPGQPGSIDILLRGEDSRGQLAVIEYPAGPGGPPLHVHPGHGEGFYVLEGEVTFQVRDRLLRGGAGTFVYAPPDTPHTFANQSGRPARLLVLCTPAGFEHYFEGLAAGTLSAPPADEAIAAGPPIEARD